MSNFVNLKTDWAFKKLMGQERQMLSFLNSLLSEEYGEIKSITFENVEFTPVHPQGRGVIFDLLCTTENNDKIIVEMQNYSQLFFNTRANYYLYTLMSKVLNRGDNWNKMKEDIPHLIEVFILNKRFGNERKSIVETEEFDRIDKVQFWDRMRKYFIILENFDFAKIEQPSSKDCWIEIIKNLGERMYKISPSVYEKADPALLELIERAQFCNLTDDELARYEAGLKAIEDEIDFEEMLEEAKVKIAAEAHAKGHAEGHAEGHVEGKKENQIETAKKMLNMGMSIDLIAEISGLSKEEIEALR
ncbi:MAG: Rpn family recombination-promoting nuclease/putative transposase [Paludibacteraceae bacterium]|nr:Rpn family recombination-promoting nuclease/putative transposase [Paludibacteraceae bacterium]